MPLQSGSKLYAALRIMPRPASFAAAIFVMAPLGPAQANDSTAHLAAGGLVLSRTDAIEMRSEDLFVSTEKIRVYYRFYNRTENEITTLVAFPLPDITAPSDENNFVIPRSEQAVNFLGFETKVNGKPIAMKVEQRALALGVDRTALLEKLSLPVAPHIAALPELLAKLSPPSLEELYELGMIKYEEYGAGPGLQLARRIQPLWSARTTYYWKQVFPAKQEVAVEHIYQPSVGGSVQTSIGADFATNETIQDYENRYCIDPLFLRAAKAMQKKHAMTGGGIVSESRLEYVLKTGANWAGAIQKFRLTVDKGEPNNLVSFCMDGVRKVSPTHFEVTKTDYWPQRNLEVLILTQSPR